VITGGVARLVRRAPSLRELAEAVWREYEA